MKKSFAIMLMGIALMAFGQKNATIVFETTTHDFGKIPQNEAQKCKFTFTNTGSDTLKIINVLVPNGCTTDYYSKIVPPQGKGQIKMVLEPIHTLGTFSKEIKVTTNDPNNQTITLHIKGEIVPKTIPGKQNNPKFEKKN